MRKLFCWLGFHKFNIPTKFVPRNMRGEGWTVWFRDENFNWKCKYCNKIK